MNDSNEPGSLNQRSPYKTNARRAKVGVVLCIIVLAVTLVLMSPIFKVKSIIVNGNSAYGDTEIIKASGISKGDSIFSVNIDISQEAVSSLGRISWVKITRSVPSKIVIDVEEHIECAYVKEKGAYTGIDENGKIMVCGGEMEEKAPLIYGLKLTDSEKGQFMKVSTKNAKEISSLITRMLTELKNQGIISQIKTIDITNLTDIRMTLVNDTVVNFGEDGDEDGDNIEYKIAYLTVIIPELPDSQKGGVIELSDTENVTSSVAEK